MKNEIPKPLAIGAIAIVVGIGGFFLWKALQGPPELPRAPITVGEEAVPKYMKDQMTPEMQKMIEEQTKKYGVKSDKVDSSTSQPVPKSSN